MAEFVVSPVAAAKRARRLHAQLVRIEQAAKLRPVDDAGAYHLEALAVEGWLRSAVATAEQLATELEGDDFDPGGEHGGPAD